MECSRPVGCQANILENDAQYITSYTDMSNKTKEVRHSVVLNNEQRNEIEERIVEELYRIFTHKAG